MTAPFNPELLAPDLDPCATFILTKPDQVKAPLEIIKPGIPFFGFVVDLAVPPVMTLALGRGENVTQLRVKTGDAISFPRALRRGLYARFPANFLANEPRTPWIAFRVTVFFVPVELTGMHQPDPFAVAQRFNSELEITAPGGEHAIISMNNFNQAQLQAMKQAGILTTDGGLPVGANPDKAVRLDSLAIESSANGRLQLLGNQALNAAGSLGHGAGLAVADPVPVPLGFYNDSGGGYLSGASGDAINVQGSHIEHPPVTGGSQIGRSGLDMDIGLGEGLWIYDETAATTLRVSASWRAMPINPVLG